MWFDVCKEQEANAEDLVYGRETHGRIQLYVNTGQGSYVQIEIRPELDTRQDEQQRANVEVRYTNV